MIWSYAWDTLMAVLAMLTMFIALSFFWAGLMFLYEAHEWLLTKVTAFWEAKKWPK